MKNLLFLSALVFAAACGGKSSGETADPCKDPCADQKMAAMTCEAMGDNIAAAMQASGEMDEGEVSGMTGTIVSECNSSAWSQETIDCLAAADSEESAEACEGSMSDEQLASFHAAMGGASEGDDEGME